MVWVSFEYINTFWCPFYCYFICLKIKGPFEILLTIPLLRGRGRRTFKFFLLELINSLFLYFQVTLKSSLIVLQMSFLIYENVLESSHRLLKKQLMSLSKVSCICLLAARIWSIRIQTHTHRIHTRTHTLKNVCFYQLVFKRLISNAVSPHLLTVAAEEKITKHLPHRKNVVRHSCEYE